MGIFSFVKPGKKVFQTIKSVKPNVGKSKIKKAIDDVRLSALKARGQMKKQSQDFEGAIRKVQTKIGQTSQKLKDEPVTKSGFTKGKDLREKRMGGGMMGRRFGMKKGTNPFKKETNVEKIKKTFGPKQKPQSRMTRKKKFPDLTGDGKVTFADILKGRGVINGKKKKNPGLAKLPIEVRNKMGYAKKGGRA